MPKRDARMTTVTPTVVDDRFIRLAASPHAPSEARREFSLAVRDWLTDDAAVTGRLLLSELISNTIRHSPATTAIPVRVVRERDGVLVEVHQEASVEAVKISKRDSDPIGGWGLQLVDQLAEAWGVRLQPPCVWFRLAA